MKQAKIKDVYNGQELTVWDDGEFITLAFGLTTIAIPYEYWDTLKQELKEFVEVIGNIYEKSEELKNDRGDDSAKYEGDNKEDETI